MNTEGLEVIALPSGRGKIQQDITSWHDGEPVEFVVDGHAGYIQVAFASSNTGNATTPEYMLAPYDPVDLASGYFKIPAADFASVAELSYVYFTLWESRGGSEPIVRCEGRMVKKAAIRVPTFSPPANALQFEDELVFFNSTLLVFTPAATV